MIEGSYVATISYCSMRPRLSLFRIRYAVSQFLPFYKVTGHSEVY